MKKRSRTEYSLINMATNLIGYFFNTLLGFMCRIIFVRLLSEEYLGISGLFTNILSMLSLAELGIGTAIIYALYKPIAENNKDKITALMHLYKKAYMFIGICVGIIGAVMIPFLPLLIGQGPNIKENIYFIYVLYLFNTVVSYFYSYKGSLLSAMQRNYIVIGYSYISTTIQSILQILYLLLTHNYMGYLIIQIITTTIYNVIISKKTDKDYSYIKNKEYTPLSKQEIKSIFKNVKALTISKLAGVLVNNTDNIFLTYFNGIISVGHASNYLLFSTTLDSLITKLFNALTGSVGNLNASSNEETSYNFFKVLNLANYWLYGWATIGIMFISSDLVALFYGEKYIMSLNIPIILSINFFTIGMLHACYTYKSTLGLFKHGQYIGVFTAIINIIMDIILGNKFGIMGIYCATLVARICTNLWYEPYVVYKYGLHKKPIHYLYRYIKYIIILFFAAIISFILCELFSNIIIKCIICTIVFNTLFIINFHNSDEFKYLKTRCLDIIRKIHNSIEK